MDARRLLLVEPGELRELFVVEAEPRARVGGTGGVRLDELAVFSFRAWRSAEELGQLREVRQVGAGGIGDHEGMWPKEPRGFEKNSESSKAPEIARLSSGQYQRPQVQFQS